MGNFQITIEAAGGHGCQREIGDGGTLLDSCGNEWCPDCETRRFVTKLQTHNSLVQAVITHWPRSSHFVVDDLLAKKRTGHF